MAFSFCILSSPLLMPWLLGGGPARGWPWCVCLGVPVSLDRLGFATVSLSLIHDGTFGGLSREHERHWPRGNRPHCAFPSGLGKWCVWDTRGSDYEIFSSPTPSLRCFCSIFQGGEDPKWKHASHSELLGLGVEQPESWVLCWGGSGTLQLLIGLCLSVLSISRKHQDSKKEEEKKKPHIKKPLNAFMLYMKEMRAKVVAECTLKESAAINQILGRRVGLSLTGKRGWHGTVAPSLRSRADFFSGLHGGMTRMTFSTPAAILSPRERARAGADR